MLKSPLDMLTACSAKLTPRLLQGLDGYLVRNFPLLWRSRLIQAAWYASLACIAMAVIGATLPMTTENVWNDTQLGAAFDGIRLASLALIAIWVFMQSRIATGEQSIGNRSRLAIFNFCAALVLLFPAHVFVATITYRTADVIPDGQLEQEWRLHEENGFWYGRRFDGNLDEEERVAIHRTTDLFGIFPDAFIMLANNPESYCPGRLPCVITASGETPVGPAIESVLQSIRLSKQMWGKKDGDYFDRYVESIFTHAGLAVLTAVVLSIAALPRYVWRRRFPRRGSGSRLPRIEASLPRWLQAIDRRLLRSRPMLWAARAHSFAYHAVTVGLMLIVAGLFILHSLHDEEFLKALQSMFGKDSILLLGTLVFIGAVGPIFWAISLGSRHIPANDTATWRAMIRSFFAASIAVPALFFCMIALKAESSIVSESIAVPIFFAYFGTVNVVSWCLVRNYLGWRAAIAACIVPSVIGFAVLFVTAFLDVSDEDTAAVIFSIGLAIWAAVNYFWVRRHVRDLARRWPLLSVMISVGAIPSVLLLGHLVLGIVVHANIPRDLIIFGTKTEFTWAVIMTTMALTTLPVYLYGMRHGMALLIAQRNNPRAQ